ncbi:hypothetical protein AYI70_g8040 [Smittium culicis]|uniref:Uncharacterized protein n=1 Tax=Smittium culicis TaxID=133412 RepID=A0A1R1XHS5_9FUNG|nr:hypothetical protein AYI70_g8040 [Smittium culicis]
MGKTERDSIKLIFRRPNNSILFQRGAYRIRKSVNEKIENSGYENKISTDEPIDTQGKGKESKERSRQTNKEGGDKYTQPLLIPRKSSSYGSISLVLTIDDYKAVRTKKFISFTKKRLDLSFKIIDTCIGKSNMVERQPTELEWKIFSTGDRRSGTFYRRQRFELRNCSGMQALLKPMEAAAVSTSNKFKGAISYSLCTKAATDTGKKFFSTL